MCYFVSSHHNCGHLHERFARCFFAQRDGNFACNEPAFPIWQSPEPFPCPDCQALRHTDTQELLSNKARKPNDATRIKANSLQPDSSIAHFSRQSSVQHQQPQPSQQVAGEFANINAQLQTLADRALHVSPPPLPLPDQLATAPWVPPSQRYASIVGQLGPSPPPQPQSHQTTSSLSPDLLSGKEPSRPDSAIATAYHEQEQMGSPSLEWLLRQA